MEFHIDSTSQLLSLRILGMWNGRTVRLPSIQVADAQRRTRNSAQGVHN